MPIDPSIALSFRPAQIAMPDPTETFRLRDLALATRQRQLQIQQQQRMIDQQEALKKAMVVDDQGRVDLPRSIAAINRIDPTVGLEMQNQVQAQQRAQQMEQQKYLAQGAYALYTMPAEKRAAAYPVIRQRALATGLFKETDLPEEMPGEEVFRALSFGALTPEEQQKVLNLVADERRKADKETREGKESAAKLEGQQLANLQAEMGVAERTVPQTPEDWTAWRAGLSPALQRRIPQAFSPAAVAQVQRMALPRKEREELARTKPPVSSAQLAFMASDPNAPEEQRIAAGNALRRLGEQQAAVQASRRAGMATASVPGIQNNIQATADGIIDGSIPPPNVESRPTQFSLALTGELKRKGYNLSVARRDWTAIQKHLGTLNGAQQERLRQAVALTADSLDVIDRLYQEWTQKGWNTRSRAFNKATLAAAKQWGGEMGAAAQALEAQINDLVSELGTVYKGGNASTDESLKLAAENLKGDWDEATFKKALGLVRENLRIRKNSILTSAPIGVSADSPYLPKQQESATRGGGAIGVKLPNGKMKFFPTQAAADGFRREAGLP